MALKLVEIQNMQHRMLLTTNAMLVYGMREEINRFLNFTTSLRTLITSELASVDATRCERLLGVIWDASRLPIRLYDRIPELAVSKKHCQCGTCIASNINYDLTKWIIVGPCTKYDREMIKMAQNRIYSDAWIRELRRMITAQIDDDDDDLWEMIYDLD